MGTDLQNIDKKKLSNEKRLQAIRERHKKQNQQVHAKAINNFGLKSKTIPEKKIRLFESDNEDDFASENSFKIRPQFDGPSGHQLFERSAQLSDRFKLDERFAEEDETKSSNVLEKDHEKLKNLKILESLLGYEVTEKYDGNITKQKGPPRFDPEDERSSKYLKTDNISVETSKKFRKNKKSEVKVEVPVSSERYIEVSKDLKNILSSATSSFSFSTKFNTNEDLKDKNEDFRFSFQSSTSNENTSVQKPPKQDFKRKLDSNINSRSMLNTENVYTFFMSESDNRLTEGVEFFQRPKPLDELREEWISKREAVLGLFKWKKKSNEKRQSKKHSTNQRKKSYIKK